MLQGWLALRLSVWRWRPAAPANRRCAVRSPAIISYWDSTTAAWLSPVYGGWALYSSSGCQRG